MLEPKWLEPKCGSTLLPSVSAVVVYAGFDLSRPPRATRTGVAVVIIVICLTPPVDFSKTAITRTRKVGFG